MRSSLINRALNREELISKNNMRSSIWELSKQVLWRHKSRVRWIKLGDRNTKYFQALANKRFRRNFVGSTIMDGRILVDPRQIKGGAIDYVSKIFEEKEWVSLRLMRPLESPCPCLKEGNWKNNFQRKR